MTGTGKSKSEELIIIRPYYQNLHLIGSLKIAAQSLSLHFPKVCQIASVTLGVTESCATLL